jgi:hypothetical protein
MVTSRGVDYRKVALPRICFWLNFVSAMVVI